MKKRAFMTGCAVMLLAAALLSGCGTEPAAQNGLTGEWISVASGSGSVTSGEEPLLTDLIFFEGGSVIFSTDYGENWGRAEWGATDDRLAIMYTFRVNQDASGYYELESNVLMDYRVEGDMLQMGYNLGGEGERIVYEMMRQ